MLGHELNLWRSPCLNLSISRGIKNRILIVRRRGLPRISEQRPMLLLEKRKYRSTILSTKPPRSHSPPAILRHFIKSLPPDLRLRIDFGAQLERAVPPRFSLSGNDHVRRLNDPTGISGNV